MGVLKLFIIKLCRLALGSAFACLIITISIQVVARTFDSSPVWTEEAARFALLYIAAFGAGLSLLTGELVNVDVICESLKGKYPWILRLISSISIATLCLVLLYPAWEYVSIGELQTSAALAVRMDFIHTSVFILLVTLFIFSILRVIEMIQGTDEGLPNRKGE